jgi:hypothetical protein
VFLGFSGTDVVSESLSLGSVGIVSGSNISSLGSLECFLFVDNVGSFSLVWDE